MRKVLGLLLLLSVVSAAWAQERQDTIVVSRDGTGNFRTLQEAIESARAFMDYTVTIYVKNGVYKEKVIVPSWVENIDIIGEDRDKTIITYDDHANINKMGTFRTYTVKVEGSDITFKNLTIENNAAQLGQAVALHTEGDRLKFINCRILGNQDTIYTGAKFTRLYFKDCYIDGTTDFIFGPSTALFEDCIIHSKRNSYVTAASTPKEAKYGYVFKHCKLTAEPGVDKVYLGRPWRPYAYTLFIYNKSSCSVNDNKRDRSTATRYRHQLRLTCKPFVLSDMSTKRALALGRLLLSICFMRAAASGSLATI